jgi:fatty-acyl-CoA synthase
MRTPRATPGLVQTLGEFSTLSDGLDYAALGETGFNFYSSRGGLAHVLPYRLLRARAHAVARRLAGHRLERGARVAVVAETGPDFMAVFFGCQYAGLVPCPMPYSIHIGGRDAYVERIRGMLKAAAATMAVAPGDLKELIVEASVGAGVRRVLTFDEINALPESDVALDPFRADEVAYIQYSSGSTSSPKGVLITQQAVTANVRGILQHGLRVQPDDRAFSWLPLYHDMGLVGFCLAPMMGQVTVDYLATSSFARRPALWLKLMSDNRSTIAYSPTFGYDLAGRRVNGSAVNLDLSGWRIAGIGGDMVRADVLDTFASNLAPSGFDRRAFLPSYGMAEATLACTFADVDQPFSIDVIDRAQYKLSRRAVPVNGAFCNPDRVRSFVVCGRPLPGHDVEVRDDAGIVLGAREIGGIFVKGPSLMAGYFQCDEATGTVLGKDGFLDTGDMGYLVDGQIVITGRAKDLILHNGRNIWPQDIEWAAERVGQLRSGDVAAFAVEGEYGEDEVVVLVQCRLSGEAAMEALRREVSAAVHRSAGVECDVVLVPGKSLPFTSSGKLSRSGAKVRYLRGEIAEISKSRADRMTADQPIAAMVAG